MAFLVLKARNQITLLLESRERQNGYGKKKGNWTFVSMSHVEDPKYLATEAENQERCRASTF